MPIERSNRPLPSQRMAAVARGLLDASTLCAIATVSADGRAHINTAYFAWTDRLEIVWLSDPGATHSRNLRARPSAAVAVYDSNQAWGEADRGIQLFGSAREAGARALPEVRDLYLSRFPVFAASDLGGFRFYRQRPRRMKLFAEDEIGSGVFVTAAVDRNGRPEWRGTEIYSGQITSK